MSDETRRWVRDFAEVARVAADADEPVELMIAKYPDFASLWALHVSVKAWLPRRIATS